MVDNTEALLRASIAEAQARKVEPAPLPLPAAMPLPALLFRYSEGPLGELFEALSKAQATMGHAAKNAANPFYESRYADLAECIDATRGPLTENGIAVIQMPMVRDGKAVVVTRFGHKSGQWMESELELAPRAPKPKFNGRGEAPAAAEGPTPQAYGSSFSHARRYAYTAMCGLAQVDDDANAASGLTEHVEAPAPAARPQPARQAPGRSWDSGRRDFDKRMSRNAAEASGIDTGQAEPGTKEAAAQVAERKLADLRSRPPAAAQAPASAPPPAARPQAAASSAPAPGSPAPILGAKQSEIKKAFAELSQRIGRARYFEELARAGVDTPIRLGSLDRIREFYSHLLSIAEVA